MFQLLMWAIPVALLAAVCQVIDQLILKKGGIGPWKAGGGWCMFQTWAMYFLIFYMMGGASAWTAGAGSNETWWMAILQGWLGYAIGIICAIAIFEIGGLLGKLGFWAMPIALFIVCIPGLFWGTVSAGDWMIGVNPALFLGAATFFVAMSYFPAQENAFKEGTTKWGKYGQTALGELTFCAIGLPMGLLTLILGEALVSLAGL